MHTPEVTPIDVDGSGLADHAFWRRPPEERDAVLARLRTLPSPPFFLEKERPGLPPGNGYYALLRHGDIAEVSRRPQDFSSSPGATTVYDLPQEYREFFGSMINMDNPRHARLRRIVSRAFGREAGSDLAERLRAVAGQLVDDLVKHGGGDFVGLVAAKMPIVVISEMLGIPHEDYQFILDRSNIIVGAYDRDFVPDVTHAKAATLAAGNELSEYLDALGEIRTEHPEDDLTTKLVTANIDGEKLTRQELASFFILLIVAGNETTRNAISNGLLLLTDHPDQKRLWLSDFEKYAPGAVEEIVRLASPIHWMRRTTIRDCVVNGHRFREGDKVLLVYRSANRDEAVFEHPERFDITRDPNPHLSFGSAGPHFCLGVHLARLETTAIFRELLSRVPDIRAEGQPRRLESNLIEGLKRLDCTFSNPPSFAGWAPGF